MILKENKCLFCESELIESKPAKIAPFISACIGTENNEIFNLVHCKNCGSAFYDYRYSEEQVEKIYNGYRNKEYQKLRQKFESWYSDDINRLLAIDKRALNSRNKNSQQFLIKNIETDKIKNVLDFGGDQGQYIPTILNNANKYVFDISQNSVLDGIISLKSLDECKDACPDGFDFVMCAHVLEHVSNPRETIQNIKNLISKNGYFYIEVPLDSPFYTSPLDNIQYLFNKHFKFKDLIKKYIEIKTSKYAYMHEHINFYTIDGLKELLKSQGFKTICAAKKKTHSVMGISKNIYLLATPM